jgi:hypothetical protein
MTKTVPMPQGWTKVTAPNYAVGHNMVGYMPESDVWITDDFESAKQSLADDIIRDLDSLEQADDVPADRLAPYNEAIEELAALKEAQEFYVILGYESYWIAFSEEEPDAE